MIIGIPRETKKNEFRVALLPENAATLRGYGHSVYVEHGAGEVCGFSDEQYAAAGARIVESVYGCDMIVRVKEPPIHTIRQDQIIMGYLHVEKGQNPRLLNALIERNTTSYAFEEIKDEAGGRLINLGVEAGIVGMYEGLRLYGNTKVADNAFRHLPHVRRLGSVRNISKVLKNAGLTNGVRIYILGKGRVSQGAQDVLKYTNITPNVLYRRETSNISRYLGKADIIVNAVDWYPGEPRIITRSMLKLMKKTAIIIDISCDREGAIESCVPTSWEQPTYCEHGILHFCVDNLPSAIPRDSSVHLAEMIFPHVLKVANGEDLPTGLMTKDGAFTYPLNSVGSGDESSLASEST